MIKIIVFLISLITALVSSFSFEFNNIFEQILVIIALTVGSIICLFILFIVTLFIITLPINKKKEQTKYSKFYRYILKVLCKISFSLFSMKVEIEGLDIVPKDTTFVIVYNHISNLDSMLLDVILCDRKLVFVAKKSLFDVPMIGKLLHAIGYIRLDRGNIRQELIAMNNGIDFANKYECSIGVSPEGTRNRTDELLLPFKPGCLKLAMKTKRPIVVSVCEKTNLVNNNLLFKKHKVKVTFTKVFTYEEISNLNTNEVSELVRNEMLKVLEK